MFAEILVGHGRALDVPPGESFAPLAVPLDVSTGLGGFPQREVAGVVLQRVGLGADAFQEVAAEVAGQFAVFRVAVDVEIDVSAGLVGFAVVHQPADHVQHFRNVMGGPGEHVGRLDVGAFLVLPEPFGVELADFLEGFALGQRGHDHLVAAGLGQFLPHVADIGDVLDVVDLEAIGLEDAADPVRHHVGPEVTDVGVPVDGWPAGVHGNPARRDRPNLFDVFRQGVVDA